MPRQKLKQRADGRYRCKYKGVEFYGRTQSEALEAREEYKRMEVLTKGQRERGITFREYAMRWLTTYKAHLTEGPYNTHARNIDRFCVEYGNTPMSDITTTDIQAFYNTASGKSKSYIDTMRDTINGIFAAAANDRIIQYNPAAAAKTPKGTVGTHRAITDEERQLIHATQHRMRLAVLVMLYAGLRRGEVLALNIDTDVDFAHNTITVNKAVRFEGTNNAPRIVQTKTEAGNRTIPMVSILADELRGHHGLVCPSAEGKLMSESAWCRSWESYMTALSETLNGDCRRWYGKRGTEMPPWRDVVIRPHDLRHSYCTMLYDAGVDLKRAMAWMGHSDSKTTQMIYTHLSNINENRMTEALENLSKKLSEGQNGGQNEALSVENIAI